MSHCYGYDSYSEFLEAGKKKEYPVKSKKTQTDILLDRIRSLEATVKSLEKQAERDEREKCFLARKAALGCFAIAYHEFKDRCSDCKFGVKNCKDILVEDWLLAAKEVCE